MTTATAVTTHVVSHRNGSQVMVRGLRLRGLGYGVGAQVRVESCADSTRAPWVFVVTNREHATLCCENPGPPEWITKGEQVRISITPAAGASGSAPAPKGSTVSKPSVSAAPPTSASAYPQRALDQVVAHISSTQPESHATAAFDVYLFSDYSGARRPGKAIVPAVAIGAGQTVVIAGRYTRESLVMCLLTILRAASARGLRVVLGVDHQYGLPIAFGRELQLDESSWRTALEQLSRGNARRRPLPDSQGDAARQLNEELRGLGHGDYFWSGTKGEDYGIPLTDPRKGQGGLRRLTETLIRHGAPMCFNKIGDNGSVGGQTLVGLPHLLSLLDRARAEGLRLKAWPFDGVRLSDPEYSPAHVLVEMYPSAVRPNHVEQADDADAVESVNYMQQLDRAGKLLALADLSNLSAKEQQQVRFEGWILAEHQNQSAS